MGPRSADNEQVTLSKQDIYRPFLLCELRLDEGTVFVCSLDKNISFSGGLYLGVGNFGKVSITRETSDSEASGLELELSGIPTDDDPDYIIIAKDTNYHGRTVIVRFGFLDENDQLTTATGDPAILFQGLIDQMFIRIGKTGTVSLTAEDDWIRWEEPLKSLYTNEEQQFLFPGDLGLEFVQQVVDKELIWGRQ